MSNVFAHNHNSEKQVGAPNKRNSLFELYRFLFSLWVVWYHGFFIFKNQYFESGYLAVEFFFFLSGFYFMNKMDKYRELPLLKGLAQMVWDKVKPLGLAFVVGMVFVIWQRVLEARPVLLGYLWYVPIMLLALGIVYFLRRLVKNDVAFVLSLIAITVACFLTLYLPIARNLGVARGIGAVSGGVLLSLIPKVHLKIKQKSINGTITSLLLGAVLFVAYLPKDNLICEYLLIFLLIPMLIYFTNTLKVNCSFFNFLGSLSFAIYAYQCVVRVIRMISPIPRYWLFVILIALVVADKLVKLLLAHYRTPKTAH